MARLAVVLDTNAYRSIGAAEFDRMQNDERNHSVVAIASYIVAVELLAHLAVETDPDFGSCLHATARLGKHCLRWNGTPSLDFMQLADAQIVRLLFDKTLVEPVQTGGVIDVIGAITDDPQPATTLQYREGLTDLRQRVFRSEQEFVDRLRDRVIRTLAPGAKDWQSVVKSPARTQLLSAIDGGEALDLIAGTIVDRAAQKASVSLNAAERVDTIARARALFPTPINHHNLLIRKIIDRGVDMSRPDRANSVWDHEITFSTAPGASVQGIPLILVTSDPLILEAARAAGTTSQVWSLTDYRSRLVARDVFIDKYL